MDPDKQLQAIVYYPQEYKMEYVKYCIPVNLCYTMLHNHKHIANGGYLWCNGQQ